MEANEFCFTTIEIRFMEGKKHSDAERLEAEKWRIKQELFIRSTQHAHSEFHTLKKHWKEGENQISIQTHLLPWWKKIQAINIIN